MDARSSTSTRQAQIISASENNSSDLADPSVAAVEQIVDAAQAAQRAALKQLKLADWIVRYHRVRFWVARRGIPVWILSLIAGSASAVLLSTFLIFAFDMSISVVGIVILLAYGIGGGATLWLLRQVGDENNINLVATRTEHLKLAEERRQVAVEHVGETTASVTAAQQHRQRVQQTLQSQANENQKEMDRLLSIDPGRLYPDEFERHIGDIFRYLGFEVEVIGHSGDQGVDVVACKGSQRIAIQAKRYIGSVGNAAVQQIYAGMAYYKCQQCMVITSGEFTAGATALAQSVDCVLIGSEKIPLLIRGEIPL